VCGLEVSQLYECCGWNGDGIGFMDRPLSHTCPADARPTRQNKTYPLHDVLVPIRHKGTASGPSQPEKKDHWRGHDLEWVVRCCTVTRGCGIRSRNHGMTLAEEPVWRPSSGRRPTRHLMTLFWCSRFRVLFRMVVLPSVVMTRV
jgi:hypothetical protein